MRKVTVIGIVGNSVFLPVEHFHVGGETVEATDAHFEYGGKGFNQAVAAARFGAQVDFIAAVGSDGYEGIDAFLRNEGITPYLVQKDTPTAFAAIVTDKTGANRVTVFQGAQLTTEDILSVKESVRSCDILLLNNEVDEQINAVAMALAPQATIILNPAPARPTSKAILDRVSIFTPNEHEAEGLDTYPNVVQTLGDKGCLIKAEDTIVPACEVKAVDTTGAGDTFNGILAACMAEGMDMKKSVACAVKGSGISVTRKGAVSSIPRRDEII